MVEMSDTTELLLRQLETAPRADHMSIITRWLDSVRASGADSDLAAELDQLEQTLKPVRGGGDYRAGAIACVRALRAIAAAEVVADD
jgi:hypothetical protein